MAKKKKPMVIQLGTPPKERVTFHRPTRAEPKRRKEKGWRDQFWDSEMGNYA